MTPFSSEQSTGSPTQSKLPIRRSFNKPNGNTVLNAISHDPISEQKR